ncbi:glycogen debranching enzyme [Sphingomonas sp. BK069]|uniref:glycogen debranching protein n=1 Tax=Sphingomonas sp. BK069 TaxID=2586979 RepID=UPI00183E0E9D|nr:glycogen debranching enzyme [Sphingomonas sp. BK069]MBB3347522.1 glycogen operon protein [Sphingomonas sp. BK069]
MTAVIEAGGVTFAVRAPAAAVLWLCLFDGQDERRVTMARDGEGWRVHVTGVGEGVRYGFRAEGDAPFDVAKLLVDPHATELDRAFAYDPRLAAYGADTAALVPKAIVRAPLPPRDLPPLTRAGGLIYEINVRGFTMLHPEVPAAQRGTVAALAHPAVIAHLRKIGVDAVELMPITAWIDERHLPPLGLRNAWGYNPVVPMALDPRLVPGGIRELRDTVAALRAAGIGTILDLVFNHTGESDLLGPTLSLRGLDDTAYARASDGTLINDTGTGNTLDFARGWVRALVCDSLRHFVAQAGVDGFRFDLATVMARGPGFAADAPIFAEIAADPLLHDRVMIAEPWDTGPGGYQLGAFPEGWWEWNDRYRDDVRRFWRGDGGAGALATRLSGSSDVFGAERTRGVSFVAAHDGFTLADLVAHAERHNHANGEDNRDGHGGEIAWNNGVEGASDDPAVRARRAADARALLATLFATRGTIMLTAGDEFGRTQRGNNNAYAQDNATIWLDWAGRDVALEDVVAALAARRRALPALRDPTLRHDARWYRLDGAPMRDADWEGADGVELRLPEFTVRVDRTARQVELRATPLSR